jgi:hypothetical protein
MIDVNATTVLIAVVCFIIGSVFGLWLRGLLMASKDEPEEDELDLMRCVAPTCQRRIPFNNWINERLLKIGYERYMKQEDKRPPIVPTNKPNPTDKHFDEIA